MGWFKYKCPNHGEFTASLQKREKTVKCPTCNSESCAIIKVGTTRIVEKLDNGIMGRAVERLHNIEEIMEERDQKHKVSQDDETSE